MIPAVVSLVLGAVGGAAFAKARSIKREAELKEERDDLQRRLAKVERAPALPPSAGALTIPAQVGYRDPDRAANITLPEDAEDFAMLEEAVTQCLESLLQAGEEPSEESLRDCVLQSIYPDFQWPPVPGDPDAARVLWLIVAHEARKELAARTAVLDGAVQGDTEEPAGSLGAGAAAAVELRRTSSPTPDLRVTSAGSQPNFTPGTGAARPYLQTNPPRRRSR